jgi:spermidine synthase
MTDPVPRGAPRGAGPLLLVSIFVIAVCGLVYELLAGALSSNSVTQFSLVIGLFLTAMGIGSFISRYVRRELLRVFIIVEIAVGGVGGTATLVLFFAFAALETYLPLLVLLSLLIGTLVGLEIPLLVRIMRGQLSLRTAIGNVLSVDYLGALAASLLFPLVLLPHLGLVRTGFLFGLLLAAGLASAGRTTSWLEDLIYDDDVVYAKTTAFQRVVLTRWRNDLRLFIDGNIQFSSIDEFRYHEALVHPAMGLVGTPRQVLVLGGGDGLAAREVLKYRGVERVTVVDLDPEMTRIFSTVAPLVDLNRGALRDRRVRIRNEDAQKFLERDDAHYQVVIVDLPDPNSESVGKLYTRSFYRLLAKRLAPGGVMVTQATSPFYATDAFWCIVATIEAADLSRGGPRFQTRPYHAPVPSFGDWGFVLASLRPMATERIGLSVPTRFLTPAVLQGLFTFPRDVARRPAPVNRLDNQVLLRLYEQGYQRYNR